MAEDILTGVAEGLVALRRQRGLSQDALAEMLNVTRQAVSSWERSKTLPDVLTLHTIAKLFDVSMDALVDGRVIPAKGQTKYELALSRFYTVWLLLAVGLCLVLGLGYNTPRVWLVSGVGCAFLFFFLGLLTHAIITLLRKD